MYSFRSKRTLCLALLVLSVAMMGFGLWRGEGRTVSKKATRVCLECIGIG